MMYEDVRSIEEKFLCTFNSRLLDRDFWLHFNDPREIFIYQYQHFSSDFPKHFIFANFRCLRCGECCDHGRTVFKEDIERWTNDLEFDILEHVYCSKKRGWCITHVDVEPCEDCGSAEIVTRRWSMRCPFVRKVRNKPYYRCGIHDTLPEECSGYLCMKSLPVAHLNWTDVDELIQSIGLEQYRALTKRNQYAENQNLS